MAGNQHSAGAFDIRNVIGLLLTIYGVILTLMGLFADPETEKTGGPNANLWAGVALLVVGLRANQIVSGLALTLFGAGLSAFLGQPIVGVPITASFRPAPTALASPSATGA